MWSVVQYLLFLGQVLVDGGNLVLLGRHRIKQPQPLHGHGVDSVGDGLVIVSGQSRFVKCLSTNLTWFCRNYSKADQKGQKKHGCVVLCLDTTKNRLILEHVTFYMFGRHQLSLLSVH